MLALELRHVLPLRRIAFGVAVVALAHPEEIRGEGYLLAGVGAHRIDGPEVVLARPAGFQNLVAVADVSGEIVLLDHVAHVLLDLGRGRDRRRGPRLEAVAEGVQVAVGADAGIFVRQPGAAKALLRLQHDKAGVGALLGEVPGCADARDAGADDEHVEMRLRIARLFGDVDLNIHCCAFFFDLRGRLALNRPGAGDRQGARCWLQYRATLISIKAAICPCGAPMSFLNLRQFAFWGKPEPISPLWRLM